MVSELWVVVNVCSDDGMHNDDGLPVGDMGTDANASACANNMRNIMG
jgi:hypothetical protein